MILNKYIKLSFLFMVTFIVLIFNFIRIEPMNPDLECCDHLFYRAQSISWLELNEKEYLKVPSGNRLNDVYKDYYYKTENQLTKQPPYVYRMLVPFTVGLFGKFTDINNSYKISNAILIFLLLFGSTIIVLQITNNLFFSLTSLFIFAKLQDFLQFYFYDYMLVDIASIVIFTYFIYFTLTKKYFIAIILASIIGSLAKETLILLGVSLSILLYKKFHKFYLFLISVLPILIQIISRILINVPSPPKISEIYIFQNILKPLYDLNLSFGLIAIFIFGLLLSKKLVILGIPTFLLIYTINSSELADGKRIWYTIIPLIFAGYALVIRKLLIYSGRSKV